MTREQIALLEIKMEQLMQFLEEQGYDCDMQDCVNFLVACIDKKIEE